MVLGKKGGTIGHTSGRVLSSRRDRRVAFAANVGLPPGLVRALLLAALGPAAAVWALVRHSEPRPPLVQPIPSASASAAPAERFYDVDDLLEGRVPPP